eukprot:753895-Hanusia_phi.AAC.5
MDRLSGLLCTRGCGIQMLRTSRNNDKLFFKTFGAGPSTVRYRKRAGFTVTSVNGPGAGPRLSEPGPAAEESGTFKALSGLSLGGPVKSLVTAALS